MSIRPLAALAWIGLAALNLLDDLLVGVHVWLALRGRYITWVRVRTGLPPTIAREA